MDNEQPVIIESGEEEMFDGVPGLLRFGVTANGQVTHKVWYVKNIGMTARSVRAEVPNIEIAVVRTPTASAA